MSFGADSKVKIGDRGLKGGKYIEKQKIKKIHTLPSSLLLDTTSALEKNLKMFLMMKVGKQLDPPTVLSNKTCLWSTKMSVHNFFAVAVFKQKKVST